MGGWADPEKCKEVQEVANLASMHPEEMQYFDWDVWGAAFDAFCLGI